MQVLSRISVSLSFVVILFSRSTLADTDVGNIKIQRANQDVTIEVLQTNDQGKPTAIAGYLGEVGMDSTYANDEEFRQKVKEELKSLLQNQVGGEWLSAEASNNRDLEAKGKSKVSKNGYAHVRLIHQVNGYPIEGASLVAHTDVDGKIFLVNGEFLDGKPVPTKPLLDSQTAISMAMEEAGISQASLRVQNLRRSQDAELAMVRDESDNVCFAWKTLADYDEVDDDGKRKQAKAILYADTQTGRLCGLHPQLYDLSPDIRTYSCTARARLDYFNNVNRMNCSLLHSESVTAISTGNVALDDAHNYAIATYNYYNDYHGLDSLDDNGHPLVSYVLAPEFQFENAFWDGSAMYYGDGNPPPEGSTFPFSLAPDVVAHELTHGVVTNSANLIYSQESGALNEALADIFGIQVKRLEGGSGPSLWYIGDKIIEGGKGIRDMSDPEAREHYDYYPTRYQGKDDNGGVHWNSGIANLAFYLFVNGGSHPRGKTSVAVKGLIEILRDEDEAFEAAGDIFFCSLWSCLTSRSNFADMRLCTTSACGMTGRLQDDEIISSLEDAWDAVGVTG